mgnify:CR=1 FL=1
MTTKRHSPEFLAELEGDATPFAAAPRHLAGRSTAGGNQTLAISSIRETATKAKVAQEERYPFSTVDIAARLPGAPSTTRVATVIVQLGLKGDSTYWCAMNVGATAFNRYSKAALQRVVDAFHDPSKHLPPDSPAFRTVMNFLEGM